MRQKERNNQGFTLVEVLIAIAILTIAITPLISNFVSSSKVNGKAKNVLKATEMSQNMFEGMTSVNPREIITELSGHAATMQNLSILPADVTCEKVYEYAVSVDPATNLPVMDANGAYVLEYMPNGATYTKTSKVLEDGTVEYIGFNESEYKIYTFGLQGVKQGNKTYDMRITMDASAYDGYIDSYDTAEEKAEVDTRARISGINSGYDCSFVEGVTELENVISTEYKNKRIDSSYGRDEKQILQALERTYILDIEKVSDDPREIEVNISMDYKYRNEHEKAPGEELEYKTHKQQIFTSAVYGLDPRNIFLYYTPNYYSKSTGNELDRILVNNKDDLDVNIYIVRMQQNQSDVLGTANMSTVGNENLYAARLEVVESDASTVDTKIRTNLDDNIMLVDENLANRRRSMDNNTYIFNGNPINVPDIMKNTVMEIKTLDAQKEESRFYNLTIEVFEGSTGNEGLVFDDNKKLTEFKGSLIE